MAGPPIRKKRQKSQSVVAKYWWLVPILIGVALIVWVATGPQWSRPQISTRSGQPVAGFISTTRNMTEEYLHFYGKPLNNSEVVQQFEQAGRRAAAGDYPNAVTLLEQVSKVAAVPVVFNNLGVAYAGMNDSAGAVSAFREALARDFDYPPVRANLDRLKDIVALGADPVRREVEPNNDATHANIIALGKSVEGTVDSAFDDVDFFRITTPPAPRDAISIEIANRSASLAPSLRIFDADQHITDWSKTAWEPGSSLHQTIAPPPNTTLYLAISGRANTSGAYTLTVQPTRAFDAYEPNDEISEARRITLDTPIAAGIMDAHDTDYYSFASPRTGTVSVSIANRSTTLIPALSTFSPDLVFAGSPPEPKTPGANLKHSFPVLANQIYYVQVRSLNNTAGDYTLTIE